MIKCFRKIVCWFVVFVFCLSFPALCAGNDVQAKVLDESAQLVADVEIDMPSGFLFYTNADVDQSVDFFNRFPISKTAAIERINKGVVIDGFSSSQQQEIQITVTSDSFSKAIVNFSPMDEAGKQKVMERLSAGLTEQQHTLLRNPEVRTIGGYDFIEYSARIGSSDSGYSYTAVMTIVGGRYYECVYYCASPVPDDETAAQMDETLGNFSLQIKGNSGELFNNTIFSVVAILVIIAACLVVLWVLFSLFRMFLRRQKQQHVRVKKRD